jgi:hypothetical protein
MKRRDEGVGGFQAKALNKIREPRASRREESGRPGDFSAPTQDIVGRAEAAPYRAKRAARDRVETE